MREGGMKVRYEPMRHRVPGVFEIWLIDGTPRPWLLGRIRNPDGSWIARSRADGDPVGGFPRRRDAAAFLAIVGGWCKRRSRRVAQAVALALLAITGTARADTVATQDLPSFQQGICTGMRAEGTIDPHRPIVVTYVGSGAPAAFECAPAAPGRQLPPVTRFVRWGF
jgi:hypothetical protein